MLLYNQLKMDNIKTYIDLYQYLQNSTYTDINDFLKIKWTGKDKQESIFRLFSYLKLFDEFNVLKLQLTEGNFNKSTIKVNENLNILTKNVKDNGDESDLTLMNMDTKTILITTSKNVNTEQIGLMGIRELIQIYTDNYKNNDYKLILCIVIRNKEEFLKNMMKAKKSNEDLKKIITSKTTIIIDWNDLNTSYIKFKQLFKDIDIKTLLNTTVKEGLIYKFHQKITIDKSMKIFETHNEILWGHLPRSGKSYMIAGMIDEINKKNNKTNYLIITTIPHTLNQCIDIFKKYSQFNDFNIINLNATTNNDITKNKEYILPNKNIILCSKQYIQSKTVVSNEIKWLKKIVIDILFIDEIDYGGTTPIAKNIYDIYGGKTKKIYITATYIKPLINFNIQNNIILWDFEDIHLCQNINDDNSRLKLIKKHNLKPEDIYNNELIKQQYINFPKLQILTLNFKDDVHKNIVDLLNENNSNDGISIESVFKLKQSNMNEFENKEYVNRLIECIFGKQIKKSKYFLEDRTSFMYKIKNQASRWLDINNPMVIICFLPCGNQNMPIDNIITAFQSLIIEEDILNDFEIVGISSNITNTPMLKIHEAKNKAKINGKKGVIVLSGKQCSIGITIKECDIVILLNNTMSLDLIYQMMFRCMTEDTNKSSGYVIDLNINRTLKIITKYAHETNVSNNSSLKNAIKYVLENRLIGLNSHEWMNDYFKINNNTKLDEFIETIFQKIIDNTLFISKTLLEKINIKNNIFTTDDINMLKCLIKIKPNNIIKLNKIKEEFQLLNENNDIPNGLIKYTEIDNTEVIADEELIVEEINDNTEESIDYINKLYTYIIPLICLLTIHNNTSSFEAIFDYINNNEELKNIFINQLSICWNINTVNKSTIIEKFIDLYNLRLKNITEFNNIIEMIKELFVHSIENQKELSKLIDEYLKPQIIERKENAEISTPYFLRQEMLNTLSNDLWKAKQITIGRGRTKRTKIELPKIFEPCSGKGGFIIDIIDRLMDGLKETYKDPKQRYKKIVEECIYFADINDINIFICKLLIDPYNKYKLNYFIGDTLELETSTYWNINSFDAVIGNPPYSSDPTKQENKPIYNKFIEKLIDNNILLFVIPSRWFAGGKGLDSFRKMMQKRKDIVLIKHIDNAKEWFGNSVNIAGGVNYFMKDIKYNGNCLFNTIEYDLSKYDCVFKPEYHYMIDKIMKYETLDSIYIGRCFGVETNDKRLKDNGKIKCYVSASQSKTHIKYLDDYEFNTKNTFWKVIITRTYCGAYSGFGSIFIGKPNEIHSGSYVSLKVNDEKEANSLYSYLKTKFSNYMLSVRKSSLDICENTLKFIPIVPFDREWTDELINDYLDLNIEW